MNPTVEQMYTYTRKGDGALELPFEKPVILPKVGDADLARHAWADVRFAADIMAEHALFFALLMPEELAAKERAEALQFSTSFGALFERIDAGPPPERSGLRKFTDEISNRSSRSSNTRPGSVRRSEPASSAASCGPSSSTTPATRQSAGRVD